MIIVKKRYVEIEIPDDESSEEDLQSLEKDLQIPSEIINDTPSEILNDIASRLGKMRIQDIAYDLNISVSIVKKHRKEILNKISEVQKAIIICQEQKIEKLRKNILDGEMERRPHNYSFGIEGLVRGIVRDLTRQGKSIREIVEQTHLETSTISYHRKKIKNGERRKYPPRIMNMTPGKKIKVERLLKRNKKQKDICKILDISSATASVIVDKIKTIGGEKNENCQDKKDSKRDM
jgi:DNA-binding NarL/FixJ family response regulator